MPTTKEAPTTVTMDMELSDQDSSKNKDTPNGKRKMSVTERKAAKKEAKRLAKLNGADDEEVDPEKAAKKAAKKAKKASKKRKNEDVADEVKAMIEEGEKGKKSRKTNDNSSVSTDTNGNPLVSAYDVRPEIVKGLAARGISHLFPIQQRTFEIVANGQDLIGRARTGTGKTLAFSLPVIEKLAKTPNRQYGRHPRVICLAPTRELAMQVSREFEITDPSLSVLCIYGGAPYGPQEAKMRKGVDVIVGTTGRVKDHIEKRNLKLDCIEHVILDEADEMLNMGFQEDVELVLSQVTEQSSSNTQILLFSATLPHWVHKLAGKYMKNDKVTIDLVKGQAVQASSQVDHILIAVHWAEKANVIGDIIRCYGKESTIIFCETKKEANELVMSASIKEECQALHGDIAQSARETTLQGFKDGRFKVLIATDVAARGIDIDTIDLVIQLEPPQSAETYIHRSGRTGRAGRSGTCVTLYTPKQQYYVEKIERVANMKFEVAGVPQLNDLVESTVKEAINQIGSVNEGVIKHFDAAACELLETKDPQQLLAAALAVITGYTDSLSHRSMLTGAQGWQTVLMRQDSEIHSRSQVWALIRRYLFANGTDDKVRGMRFCADYCGAVFDVPSSEDKIILDAVDKTKDGNQSCKITVPTSLPELEPIQSVQPPPQRWGRKSGGGGGGGRGYGGGGGRSGGRGRGGGGRGGGGGGYRGRR